MKTITNKWLFLSDKNLAVDLSRIISRLEYSARKQAEDYFYENGKSLDERVKNEINSLLIERGYPEKIGDFQIIDIAEYYKRPDKSSKKEAIKVFLNQDENSFLYSFGFEPIPREEAKQEDIDRMFGGKKKHKIIYFKGFLAEAASGESGYILDPRIKIWETKEINIDSEPEKTQQYKVSFILLKENKFKIKFYTKEAIVKKTILCIAHPKGTFELLDLTNLSEGTSTSESKNGDEFEIEDVLKFHWERINLDDFHKVFLKVYG